MVFLAYGYLIRVKGGGGGVEKLGIYGTRAAEGGRDGPRSVAPEMHDEHQIEAHAHLHDSGPPGGVQGG
jgi:hypothetical protein